MDFKVFQYFSQVFLTTMIVLFPIINPLGTGLALNSILSQLTNNERRSAARSIAVYAFSLCVATLLIGQPILKLFGLSIPIVQLAGGILIIKAGWELFNNSSNESKDHDMNSLDNIKTQLFYPLTFPITAGAGVMAAIISLSAKNFNTTWFNITVSFLAIVAGIFVNCILVYIVYNNSIKITAKLNTSMQNVINKISAFLIFCVGLDILWDALSKLINSIR